MKKTIIAISAVFALAAPAWAGPASAGDGAAEAASTVVNGDVEINVSVDNQIALAIGQRAEAYAEQGVIYQNTSINGDVEITATADNQIALAIGQDTYASARQGVVGAPLPRR